MLVSISDLGVFNAYFTTLDGVLNTWVFYVGGNAYFTRLDGVLIHVFYVGGNAYLEVLDAR